MNTTKQQTLEQKVQELMVETQAPGVAVGILHQSQEELAGYGVTNVRHPLPVDADTLFQIGSISKTMTATVAMRLVEQGKLDLDVPVRTYLPDFRLADTAATEHATLRHLFTHVGGWLGDYFENTGNGDDALARYVAKMEHLPQLTPLGEIWSYNNAGFSLAGRVIEAATGEPFERVVQEQLFQPLGMEMSFFFTADIMTHRFATGHIVADGKVNPATPWALARSAHAAGGVISTVRDLLRYARLHLGTVEAAEKMGLQATTITAMQKAQARAGNFAEAVGISWMLHSVAGVQLVSHGGATNGQIATFVLAPARQFALAVLTNANRGREVTRDLTSWALEQYLGIKATPPAIYKLTPEDLQPYCGYYTARLTDIEVSASEGELVLKVIPKGGFPDKDSPPAPTPPLARAAFFDADRVVVVDGPTKESLCEFLRGPDGRVLWFRVGGRVHQRQVKQ